jgi:hypothetical protein
MSGALPPGWERRMQGTTPYFVDHNTARTTWQDPRLVLPQQQPFPVATAAAPTVVSTAATPQTHPAYQGANMTASPGLAAYPSQPQPPVRGAPASGVVAGGVAPPSDVLTGDTAAIRLPGGSSSNRQLAGPAAAGVQTPLPAGWEEGRTAEGVPYFINHATRTTQWHRPIIAPAAPKPMPAPIPALTQPPTAVTGLPAGPIPSWPPAATLQPTVPADAAVWGGQPQPQPQPRPTALPPTLDPIGDSSGGPTEAELRDFERRVKAAAAASAREQEERLQRCGDRHRQAGRQPAAAAAASFPPN